ncbi:MAG: DDE-type integrase/transposase/recombinase [Pseudomonadota bacterium]
MVARLGSQSAALIRRDRRRPNDEWHLDERVVSISGRKHAFWRVVDADDQVLNILLQSRRDIAAAKRFLRKPLRRWGWPRVIVADTLASAPAIGKLVPGPDHRRHNGLVGQHRPRTDTLEGV